MLQLILCHHHYIKISPCVCVCVCVECVRVIDGSGMFRGRTSLVTCRGRTSLVTCNLCTYYTLYCLCVIISGHNWGALKQQLKHMQSESSNWSVDAIGEQHLKWVLLGSSNWSKRSKWSCLLPISLRLWICVSHIPDSANRWTEGY